MKKGKQVFKFTGPTNKPVIGQEIPMLFGTSIVGDYSRKHTIRRRKGGGFIERITLTVRKKKRRK